MEDRKRLSMILTRLGGDPYRANGQLKPVSTLNREIGEIESSQTGGCGKPNKLTEQMGGCGCGKPKRMTEQMGGCGCGKPKRMTEQMGGDYKHLPDSAKYKAKKWIEEVKMVQDETELTFKEALKEASKRRLQENQQYETSEQRYVRHLNDIRKSEKAYSPHGSKHKRPLSLETAQKLLSDYHMQRNDQYSKGLLKAIRKSSNLSTGEYVVNPLTGREIKKGGVTHKNLIERNVL